MGWRGVRAVIEIPNGGKSPCSASAASSQSPLRVGSSPWEWGQQPFPQQSLLFAEGRWRGAMVSKLPGLSPGVSPAEKCPEKEKSPIFLLRSCVCLGWSGRRVPRHGQCRRPGAASPVHPRQGALTTLFQRRAVIYFNHLYRRQN